MTDKEIDEVKHVEQMLTEIGEKRSAERVAKLRRSHSAAIGTLKRLHSDNMKLRKELGLPSYLDERSEK